MTTAYINANEEAWRQLEESGFYSIPGWDFKTRLFTLQFGEHDWLTIEMKPSIDDSKYGCSIIPDDWKRHGVEDAWVSVEGNKSIVHVLMKDSTAPLVWTQFN